MVGVCVGGAVVASECNGVHMSSRLHQHDQTSMLCVCSACVQPLQKVGLSC